jgi:hypothetical protein
MLCFCVLSLLVSRSLLAFTFAIRTLLSEFSNYLRNAKWCNIHILYIDRQLTCLYKLQITIKLILLNTQRNWGDTWALQRSLWRRSSVLSSDRDVQHNVAVCLLRILNFEWKMHDKNADGNNLAWVCEGWSAISEEFRTLRKEKQEYMCYKPDGRKGWASIFGRAPQCFPRQLFGAGPEAHTALYMMSVRNSFHGSNMVIAWS